MSRFPIQDPFYEAIERADDEERMARILSMPLSRPVRYGCYAASADMSPIADRDPGDEDETTLPPGDTGEKESE